MATISNVNGKKITKIKYKGEIYDTGGGDPLKEYLDETKDASYLFCGRVNEYSIGTWEKNLTYERLQKILSYDTTSNVTNMAGMFYFCKQLTSIPSINTSLVTDMQSMFLYCSKLPTIPLLDTSKVTNMSSMFSDCSKITTIPQLDTSNVTNTRRMFFKCTSLTVIPQLNTSKVTDMSSMFESCSSLTTIPQLNTSNVKYLNSTFSDCSNLTTIDITHFKFTDTYYSDYFAYNCYSLTKLIIRNMTTIPSLNSNAFTNCYHFKGTTNATYNPQGLKDGRIYVPDDKVEALKTATNWSVYADIIVPLSTLVE